MWLAICLGESVHRDGWTLYATFLAGVLLLNVCLKLLCVYVFIEYKEDLEINRWTKLLNDLKQQDKPT